VQATDNSGSACIAETVFNINSPTGLFIGNYSGSMNCGQGQNYIYVYYSGGMSPINYSISPNSGTFSGNLFSNLSNGNYIVTSTDANGCTATTFAVINGTSSIPGLTTSSIATPSSCVNSTDGAIDLTVSGFSGALNFNWDNGFANTEDLNNIPSGAYDCLITGPATGNCYWHNDSLGILGSPFIYLTGQATQPSCSLANGQINAYAQSGTPPYNYTLLPNNISNSTGLFNNLGSGGYTVVCSDASGSTCTQSTTFVLNNQSFNFMVYASAYSGNCLQGTVSSIYVTSNGSGAITYSILPNIGIQNGGFFSNLSNGIYTITATSTTGCSATTVATINGSNPIPGLVVSAVSQVPSCSTNNGSIDLTQSGFSGTLIYDWSYNGTSSFATTQDISNLAQGIYNCLITDPATGNCHSYSDSLYSPSISYSVLQTIMPTCVNNNGVIELQGLNGTAPYTYTLNPGNIINNTGLFTGLGSAVYTIGIQDINGCSSAAVYTLFSGTVSLYIRSYSGSCSTSTSSSIYYNAWSQMGTVNVTLNPNLGTISQNSFINLPNGTYTVTATDGSGCTATSTAVINGTSTINGLSVTSIVQQESCFGTQDASIDITLSGGPSNLDFSWSNGATTEDLFNITAGYYSLQITDPLTGNCFIWTDSIGVSGVNCGSISGKIFDDNNNNCIQDAAEADLINVLVTLSNGQIGYTNWTGNYSISNIPLGNYTITQTLPIGAVQNSCTQPSAISLTASNPNLINIDFKDDAPIACEAWIIAWPNSQFLPGGMGQCHMFYDVNAYQNCTGNIYFIIPQGLSFSSATVPPNNVYRTPNGDSCVWLSMPLSGVSQHIYILQYSYDCYHGAINYLACTYHTERFRFIFVK